MSRRKHHKFPKNKIIETGSLEDLTACILALPWTQCSMCHAPVLRTARTRRKWPECPHACTGLEMTLVSAPVIATRRLWANWTVEAVCEQVDKFMRKVYRKTRRVRA